MMSVKHDAVHPLVWKLALAGPQVFYDWDFDKLSLMYSDGYYLYVIHKDGDIIQLPPNFLDEETMVRFRKAYYHVGPF